MVKHGGDPFLRLAVVNLTGSAICLPFLFVVAPPVAAAWPWLLASVGIHIAYCSLLCLGYRLGDLSQVYPVARGVAPPLVALLGWLVAGEAPSWSGLLALALISGGIMLIAFGQAPARPERPAAAAGAGCAAAPSAPTRSATALASGRRRARSNTSSGSSSSTGCRSGWACCG